MIESVIHKWTRGAYWYATKRALPVGTALGHSVPDAGSDESGLRVLLQDGARTLRAVFEVPEFRVWGHISAHDTQNSAWMFAFFNQVVFFGASGMAAKAIETGDASEWRNSLKLGE